MNDRIGIGWRGELSAGILSNTESIDVVEVIVDDYFKAPKKVLGSLQTLAAQIPVIYHGVSLGLASVSSVENDRLESLARVLGFLRPDVWSEHLAFVRAGGVEIGHLAAPPRTSHTVEGSLENLYRIRRVVGSSPVLENIATLVEPLGSTLDEATWVRSIVGVEHGLLLDLHNLYSNALNFGKTPEALLAQFPVEQTRIVHLSGGRWVEDRLLDDHLHDVPDPVFEMLKWVGEKAPHAIDVIVERDGNFPDFAVLLNQVKRARLALAEGRRKRVTH